MPEGMEYNDAPELTSPLVPLFVITNGRALPPDHEYEHTTLVTAAPVNGQAAARTLSPEAGQVLDLVADGFLSVAEVAGHTHLPWASSASCWRSWRTTGSSSRGHRYRARNVSTENWSAPCSKA